MSEPGFYRPPPIGGEPVQPRGPAPKKKSRLVLYIVLAVFLFLALAVGTVIYGVSAFFDGLTEPLREKAAEVLRECPVVVEQMGEPTLLEGNWFGLPQGNVQTSNDTGTAEITYRVESERGSGSVSLTAEMTNGTWQPSKVLVTPEGGDPIDLLHCMAREHSRLACQQGQAETCLQAGVLFMTSAAGLNRDDAEALRLFEAGCTQGHVPSCRASETGGVSALAKDSQQGLPHAADAGPAPE